jgi:hypothetical protein
MQTRLKFLKLIVHSEVPPECGLTGLCGGYEMKEWRYSQFATWLFDEHLLDFALRYSEFKLVDGKTAPKKLREAAKTIFQSDNIKRGEFGELMLHGIIKEAYNTIPAISKIYFKDSPNDTVKGFDAVHIISNDEGLELWLGEVKFYNDFARAVRDVVAEIATHFEKNYLRNEFAAISNKLDKAFPHYDKLVKLLDPNTSLDDIFKSVCVPVLLTYDSQCVAMHQEFNDAYLKEIKPEVNNNHTYFLEKVRCPVKIHLFLLPLEDKKKLSQTLLNRLSSWQQI